MDSNAFSHSKKFNFGNKALILQPLPQTSADRTDAEINKPVSVSEIGAAE